MSKAPFAKIKSLVERRKLFERLVEANGEIVCKNEDDTLFILKPERVLGGIMLQSKLINMEKLPLKDLSTIGNFRVGADSYFFNGDLKIGKDQALLDLSCNVFLLQRRATMRIGIRSQMGFFIAVTEFDGKAIYLIAHVSDISAGGARIFFTSFYSTAGIVGESKDPGLKVGSRFKAIIHPPSGKTIEVVCLVKHMQKTPLEDKEIEQFGVEFIELAERQKNRLVAMGMDLQQKIVSKYVDNL